MIKATIQLSPETLRKLEALTNNEGLNSRMEKAIDNYALHNAAEIKAEQEFIRLGFIEPTLWAFVQARLLENAERKRKP